MLLPEDRLERLVEQLKGLPRADRDAILARLSLDERAEIKARLRGSAQRPWSPFSADIAARIEAGDEAPLTNAARASLADAASRRANAAVPGSLAEVVLRKFLQWGRA
ncbi:MAG: hypothetical protein ABW182_14610 [Sphingomonas sp.]